MKWWTRGKSNPRPPSISQSLLRPFPPRFFLGSGRGQGADADDPIPGFPRPMAPGAPRTYPPFIPAGPVPRGGGSGGRRPGLLGQGEIRDGGGRGEALDFGTDGGGVSVVVSVLPRGF